MPEFREDHDPLGYHDDLREALALPELAEFDRPGPVSAAARKAACWLAITLGRCRLFGVEPGEGLDGTLPVGVAVEAARELTGDLRRWAEQAHRLGQSWDEARDPVEADDCCVGLLEARMCAWAAFVAIDEAYAASLEESSPRAKELTTEVDVLLDAQAAFDAALRKEALLLSQAAGTELLNNWRALLAGPYRDPLPWWLDGTLEEAAFRLARRAHDTQPGEAVWRRQKPALFPQTRAVIFLLPRRVYRVARAAAQAPAAEPAAERTVTWESPDGRLRAILVVPAEAYEDENLVVSFWADDQPATELAGHPATLATVPANISPEGTASFPIASLLGPAQQDQELRVGADGQVWKRRE